MKKTNNNNGNIEDYIKDLDINLADLEKIGVFFLLFGYSFYVLAANLDILEALEKNYTEIMPTDIFILGQRFVVLGYIILYIVSLKRINERTIRNNCMGDEYDLDPYFLVSTSYLFSIIANIIRLEAFIKIDR